MCSGKMFFVNTAHPGADELIQALSNNAPLRPGAIIPLSNTAFEAMVEAMEVLEIDDE